MKKALIFASALFTLIIALVFFYFKDTFQTKESKLNIFAFVSVSNAVVLQFKLEEDLIALFKETNNSSYLFSEKYLKELRMLHQLSINCRNVADAVANNSILIAFKPITVDQIGATYIVDVKNRPLDELSTFFLTDTGKLAPATKRNFANNEIWALNISSDSVLSYAFVDHFLIFSFSAVLLEEAIRAKSNLSNFQSQPGFANLLASSTSNERSVAKVYINYNASTEFCRTFFKPLFYPMLTNLKKVAGYSSLNLNYKSDAWILNGQTSTNEKDYFSVFEGQLPTSSYLKAYIPNNTLAFSDYIVSDFNLFRSKLKALLLKQNDFSVNAEMNLTSKKFQIDVNALINKCVGVEFLYLFNAPITSNGNSNLAMMHLKQIDDFQLQIQQINSRIKKSQRINYKGVELNSFPIRRWMFMCLGKPFKNFEANYYCIIEDRLLLGTTQKSIFNYIDSYNSAQMLVNKESFQTFSAALSNQYNFLFYVNVADQIDAIGEVLSLDAQRKLTDINGWKNYDGLAIQLAAEQNILISNIYLPIKLAANNSIMPIWKYDMKAGCNHAPQFVFQLGSQSPEILIQDDSNNLCLIDFKSNLKWKYKLNEKILGKVFEVDFYKNGETQLLFNTGHFLHCISAEGKAMPNYPIRLSNTANMGISVLDYDNNKNYRIFVACENKIVNGYEINGRPLDGWNSKKIGKIAEPIQHIRVQGKDFLFMHTAEGEFYFYNRKGEIQSQFKDSLNVSYHNPFVFVSDSTYSNNRFVSTDQNGKIKSIFIDGHRMYKTVGNWTEQHFFDYADVSADEKPEYIFIDNNQLIVYKDDTVLSFNYQFKTVIDQPAFILSLSENKKLVGVISATTNQIYLFDREGLLLPDFPLPGANKPDIIKFQDKTYLIVTGSDHSLCLYEIKL